MNHLNIQVRRLRSFALLFLLVFLTGGCAATGNTLGPRPALELSTVVEAYLQLYQPGPLPRLFQTTTIYDRNGVLLAELFGEGRRQWIGLEEISPHLIEATIATEDATFFTNTGIDPVRIAGAALQNMEEGEIVSGASTITMQLARNLFLGSEDRYDQSLDRKIIEAGLARELTEAYSKNELLEMYLNLLNYGQLAYGPQAAAQVYFGKDAADLNLAEATLLAGIPQQPAELDLLNNFGAAKQRQETVLALMVRHGYLDAEEANSVYSTPVALNAKPERREVLAPHFVNYVIEELESRLGDGYVPRAGLQVYTTLDLRLQERAQQIVAEVVAELAPRYDMNNGALVAMRPESGEILAMVGSVDYENEEIDGQVNVTTRLRQPGSSIKPVLYATALSDNLISPATVLWDTPVTYTITVDDDYRPLNYDRKFHGPVTARAALANSYNVPAVKLLHRVGVGRMLESARTMGITSLTRGTDWYGLSLTLGGGEVTLLDLATAYRTMANEGLAQPPRYLLSISDSEGVSLLDELSPPVVQALSPEAASLITDIMSDNPARVPMFGANSLLTLDRPVAAKTGTTDDNRDAWTMGFTRYLLAGVWVGNTDGRPMENATGASAAAPIWNRFMATVLSEPDLLDILDAPTELEAWAFELHPDLTLLEECPPNLTCRRDGGELFTSDWLEAAGEGSPLADSVETGPMAAVYAGGRLAGYCGDPRGVRRIMLHLPDDLGLPNPDAAERLASAGGDVSVGATQTDPIQITDQLARERQEVIRWSIGAGGWLYFGACTDVNQIARQQRIGLSVSLNVAAAEDTQSEGESETQDVSDSQGEGATPATSQPLVSGRYVLDRVYHDDSCGGRYLLGTVINWSGAAVPGVRLVLNDAWGNRYQAVSKNGATDFGRFDFPLYSGSPQTFTLQVLDGAGNPASEPFAIPHRLDATSDFECHHVVIRGG